MADICQIEINGVRYNINDAQAKANIAKIMSVLGDINYYSDRSVSAMLTDLLERVYLPSVSASDNGKFLRVVNGAWVAESILNAEEVSV